MRRNIFVTPDLKNNGNFLRAFRYQLVSVGKLPSLPAASGS